MKKIWSFFGVVARAGLAAAVFVSLIVFPPESHAARTVTSATLNGGTSVTVTPSAAITAVVNVTTDGSGNAAQWRSTGWRISTTPPAPGDTCVDHANYDAAGAYSETFSISAPATPGTYNAYFIAYSNNNCNSGASATYTMASAVIVVNNPVPTTTSISPASKNLGAATFTMTVNGANFVAGSVVRFNGSDRTTAFVSATQVTATIPASDLLAVGTFPITVFNPAPGGGTSNAQTFTVNPAPPTATTNAASGVTAAVATLNGTVSSNGASTTVTFEYGLTAAYGDSIAATPSPLAFDAVNAAVSAELVGLNCNTLFHYRVVATNSAGTTNGLDGTFTTGACSAPFPATACAATRYGANLGCTANDVNLTNIVLAPSSIASCVSGTPVTLDLDLTVNFSSPNRWDVGIFIANDGKLPTLLPANGGANSCSVDVLPITPPAFGDTFPDLDGAPQGTADTCGDGNGSINGGTGSGVKRMTGVTLPCYASPASGGKLFVPFVVSWDNQKSPVGNLCTSNLYPVPNTTSKCNAPLSTVSIDVVVLPVITKTNGGTTLNPGANTTYTVVITNNSGGTLLDAVFTDPAVTDLTVNSVSCAAANGASCPAATVAAMQGAGIGIPSANLPNNGSLTFTIGATVSSGATVGSNLVNTATVTVSGNSTSATDTDLIVIAPSAAKSFAPSTITEGAASVLTVTLTNPTASPVTGVAFTDTYPSGMVNTAAANGATTCGGTVTAANNGNSVALSGGTIPASGSCTVTVNVTSAVAGSYTNSTGTVTTDSGPIPAASAPLTVNAPVFGAFNACDVGTTCTNTTTVTDSHITTKIAGAAFSLDLVALKNDGIRNTSYNNTVLVELLDASNNSGALDSYNCRSTWTTVIATLSPNPAFVPANNGLITVGPFTVPEAYRDVRVRVTNVGGATKKGCSTDNFAIRPDTLIVSPTDTDWQTAGTARALVNTDVSGAIVHKAGQPFTITATAKNASNVTTANYAGAPASVLSACVDTGCPASLGSFVLGATSFVSGILTSNVATYSEVGAFNLTLQDTDFASVDASDTAASCGAGRYVCGTTPVGRFVPDHFIVTPGTLTNRRLLGCSPASNFTYAGEQLRVAFTLTARNGAATPAVTLNYASGFAKFNGTVIANFGFGAADLADPTPPTGATALTGSLGLVASSGSWGAGVGSFTADLGLNRSTAPDGPYESFRLGIVPTDTDGVTVRTSDLDLDTTVPPDTNDRVLVGSSIVRFGRLKLSNAYGSELIDLPVPIETQYYNGTAFITNAQDNCTTLMTDNVKLTTGLSGITATLGGAFVNGKGSLKLSKPSPAVKGAVDICIDLDAGAGGDTTCQATTPADMSYLQGKWSGANYDKDPVVRGAFGLHKSSIEIIFIRENY